MKKILMALAIGVMAYSSAEAQVKKQASTAKETCSLSADKKHITCCKTTENPAYKIEGKTAVVHKVRRKQAPKKTATVELRPMRKVYYAKDYQVCKDEGGYYTCCLYESTTGPVLESW